MTRFVGAAIVVTCVARPAGYRAQSVLSPDPAKLLAIGKYDDAEAAARTLVDRVAASDGSESLAAASANDLYIEALLRNGRNPESFIDLARHVVRLKEKLFGLDDSHVADSLTNLGDTLIQNADYVPACRVLERAVAIRERQGGADPTGLAVALERLARAYRDVRSLDKALHAVDRSLHLREQSRAATPMGIAETLELKADVLQRKGDYEQAGALIRRALSIRDGGNIEHPAAVATLNLMGLQLWFEGNLSDSLKMCLRARDAADRLLRRDHPIRARTLKNLAVTTADLGNIADARALQEEALAIAQRNFGEAYHEIAGYLSDLAISNLRLGNLQTARMLFERALRIREARLDTRADLVAGVVQDLAVVDATLGDYIAARREHRRAMSIWEKTLGPSHPYVAIALTDLASVMRDQGAAAEALTLLERALAIRERSLGREHRMVAATLTDLAGTLKDMGRLAQAQELSDRALRIWETIGQSDGPDFARTLDGRAELEVNLGHFASARSHYQHALDIERGLFGAGHPVVAATQVGLAGTLAQLANPQDALDNAVQAEDATREHLRRMLRYLPERQSLSYAARRPKSLDLMLSLIDSRPEAAGLAVDELIRGRALVLDEMATRGRAGTGGEDAVRLRTTLNSAEQRLANLVVQGPSSQSPAQYQALLADARREKEAAERALAAQSADARAEMSRATLGFEDIQRALPSDAALISFVRYGRTRPSSGKMKSVRSYAAFITTGSDREALWVPLGTVVSIDALVEAWRAELHGAGLSTGQPVEAERSYKVVAERLRHAVWDRVVGGLPASVTRIFVVPDGSLNLVNWAALPASDGRYVAEHDALIHYLSTERDLVPMDPRAVGRGLLAIGGPAFDDRAATAATATSARRSGCGDLSRMRFDDLPGARTEAKEIAGLWLGRDTDTATVLSGRAASESAVKAAMPGVRCIHLATHGFFLGGDCKWPTSGTRAVGGLAPASTPSANRAALENPLLLAGLALAGANRRGVVRADQDDGILTAEEIASLNLRGTEWAVLSACDTGLGEIKAGEGVFGLRRAFQIAGVRTVIMSLWAVDDQATRPWMRALYKGRFQQHLSTAEAVHQADLEILRSRRAHGQSTHPFYWAGFVAAGDWR